MSLVGHLTELRDRLVKVVIAVAVASIVGFYFGDQIVAILRAPVPGDQPLYYTGIGDAFAIRLKISLVVGVILAMPVILFQVWRFVAPGPHRARAAPRPAVDPARAGVLRPRHRHRVLRAAVRGHVPARRSRAPTSSR